MRINTCIAAALFATVLCTPTANAQQALRGEGEAVPGSYIVVLKDGVSASPQSLLSKYEGSLKRTYKAVLNGFSVRDMSEHQARRLAADPKVSYVQRNLILSGQTTQWNAPWNLDRIDQRALPLNAQYTYPNNAAAGVRAYVLDSGVRITHNEFEGRASHGFDFIDDDADASDCAGHGTHVAGTIAGRTSGVAKRAQVVSVRVLGCDNMADQDSVVSGIEWVTVNGRRPAVVNMSLGGFGQNDLMENAIRRSIAAGFTYVLAAGNDGRDACGFTPARLPEAITVGATDRNDNRSLWPQWAKESNWGRCVDIWAPGTDVRSASSANDFATRLDSGTSMAAPSVAGAAALHLSANPNATNQQVRDALVNGATTTANLRDLRAGSPDRLLRIGN
ncbi:S8 family peptidase [Lentzea sp. BCCO 10_0061]|uniref:S8 family peptidase n=1 Tax=Lentzea sokolovensis TaxID=3095429 RepID=A0ABU4UTY9_9PSEU|nr:S8 family peptidase [Lentzea sp. BCCO 10_0061]MDX8142978.1 S8 family peptidase [Lentzea sp. BCCO 10_0061]